MEGLRAIRVKQGLTQAQLAKIAGVTQSYISLLERGARKNPNYATIKRIAAVLNVRVEYIG